MRSRVSRGCEDLRTALSQTQEWLAGRLEEAFGRHVAIGAEARWMFDFPWSAPLRPEHRLRTGTQSNSTLMLSRWWIRRMASPNSGATETTSTLEDRTGASGSTLFVTNKSSIGLSSRASMLRWVNTP
jgi:hypothetical protein